ncbi:MAG: DUF1778 domain-containing protein [Gammaproteobacteria bacterium]|nr:DUF1778 domain-containing protein [Gammaproteobacteria bacterium]MBU1725817.1 DUF1778 domain-containing protein [Gammaproteobacteria bacterium]MBU2007320.1 DUF1778 domain-containing protein [Gammaproteobacteria bacterium]
MPASTTQTTPTAHTNCFGLATEQTLLKQRLFMVSGQQCRALLELLDQPPQANAGLERLFSKNAPWEQ